MQATQTDNGILKRALDVVEKVGNKVPHPAMIFLFLMIVVIALSHVLHLTGASVTQQVIDPQTDQLLPHPGSWRFPPPSSFHCTMRRASA